MFFLLPCLILLLPSSAEGSRQAAIAKIRPSYQRVFREAYGMGLSDTEIDDYLYDIIAEKRGLVVTSQRELAATSILSHSAGAGFAGDSLVQTDDVLKCQPRVKVLPVTHFYPKQPGVKGSYRPSCVALHRCSNDSGCCREHNSCVPKTRRSFTANYVLVTATLEGAEDTVVQLTFENDTECHCMPSTQVRQQCVCPWPYRRHPDDLRCICSCFGNSENGDTGGGGESRACSAIAEGRRPLTWLPARNSNVTKTAYLNCSSNSSNRGHGPFKCGLPACVYGTFSFANWSCPASFASGVTAATSARRRTSSSVTAVLRSNELQQIVTEGEEPHEMAKRSEISSLLGTSSPAPLSQVSSQENYDYDDMARWPARENRTEPNVSCAAAGCLREAARLGNFESQLSGGADRKLLAWMRPGVVLERGGSAAQTRLGRDLWKAAGDLQRRGDISSCVEEKVNVVVDKHETVSCMLHPRVPQVYLVRTTRGSLICIPSG